MLHYDHFLHLVFYIFAAAAAKKCRSLVVDEALRVGEASARGNSHDGRDEGASRDGKLMLFLVGKHQAAKGTVVLMDFALLVPDDLLGEALMEE